MFARCFGSHPQHTHCEVEPLNSCYTPDRLEPYGTVFPFVLTCLRMHSVPEWHLQLILSPVIKDLRSSNKSNFFCSPSDVDHKEKWFLPWMRFFYVTGFFAVAQGRFQFLVFRDCLSQDKISISGIYILMRIRRKSLTSIPPVWRAQSCRVLHAAPAKLRFPIVHCWSLKHQIPLLICCFWDLKRLFWNWLLTPGMNIYKAAHLGPRCKENLEVITSQGGRFPTLAAPHPPDPQSFRASCV